MNVATTSGKNRPAILVSGGKQCGKTTLVESFIGSLNRRELRVAGLLAKGLWENDLRAGFDLVDLSDGRRTPLARRRAAPHPRHGMMFDFLEEGLRAGVRALAPMVCRAADIVVVDEMGRLEAAGAGWLPSVRTLLALPIPSFILIVRLDCRQTICDLCGLGNPPVIYADAPQALDRLRSAAKGFMR